MKIPNQSAGVVRRAGCGATLPRVRPSLYSLENVGLGELVGGRQLLADILGPFWGTSPGSCSLACGEERSDCFREGGTRAGCDQAHRQCLWDCFFAA